MCNYLAAAKQCCRTISPRMIDVYYTPGSPPCRLVLLVTAALAIPINRIRVDLKKEEHMTPEFVKLNPQHIVPTIVDNGFVLWESRAIARYLVNQYSEDALLYPVDPRIRAIVDQRLDFDLGTLGPAFSQFYYPQLFSGTPPGPEQTKKMDDAMKLLDTFLEEKEYVAGGQHMTIADLSIVTTISTMDAIGFSLDQYPNVLRWFNVMKTTTPGYDTYNETGLREFGRLVDEVNEVRAEVGASRAANAVNPNTTNTSYNIQISSPPDHNNYQDYKPQTQQTTSARQPPQPGPQNQPARLAQGRITPKDEKYKNQLHRKSSIGSMLYISSQMAPEKIPSTTIIAQSRALNQAQARDSASDYSNIIDMESHASKELKTNAPTVLDPKTKVKPRPTKKK